MCNLVTKNEEVTGLSEKIKFLVGLLNIVDPIQESASAQHRRLRVSRVKNERAISPEMCR